ncbi:hypothetical protein DSS3PM1_00004 [Bacteriophage DSS3_PM1]|uniref:Uncharacterized protein n=1 Tax=Bacteriophage DSS3_VP1 TaxID=2664196 RepID=A0A7S5KQC5_9CAUD|nr:hypothetical protein KNU84_gp061 [Bacteriophage DSS3_VP1]QGH74643.1 hypothetical protein DSS3VP1_00075 [Bacteriophage DSS3_VP1]QGH74681.1 hypothetical protein DSS3PM1_00004 [Bacteriophage DSS3_PM1]
MSDFRFNSVDMLLMDPFFVKGVLMVMYNHTNPETIKEEEPELFSLITQIFDEEAVEVEESWVIPHASFDYAQSLMDETKIPKERIN